MVVFGGSTASGGQSDTVHTLHVDSTGLTSAVPDDDTGMATTLVGTWSRHDVISRASAISGVDTPAPFSSPREGAAFVAAGGTVYYTGGLQVAKLGRGSTHKSVLSGVRVSSPPPP